MSGAEFQRPSLNLFPQDLIDRAAKATRLSYSGAYLPRREGIEHIVALWGNAHWQAKQYYTDDEWDVYNHHERVISVWRKAAEVSVASGQYDLAYQALGNAEEWTFVDHKREMLQDPISITRNHLRLREVFFVVDFDHTLAQSTIAHERLREAIYGELPESVKELGYSGFREVFEVAYQEHQKETGMHTPEVMLAYLARYLGLGDIPQGMRDAYVAYCNAFQDSLFMGARAVLGRLGEIGGTSILTFGDEVLQRVSIYQSGVTDAYGDKGNVVVVQKKSPDAILTALRGAGYKGSGQIIGIGDRPSDASAIKTFNPEAVSIRVRNPAGKYSLEEPRRENEIPDFEFQTLLDLDVNLHLVFQKILGR